MPRNPNVDGRIEAEGEFTLYENYWKKLKDTLLGPAFFEQLEALLEGLKGLEWWEFRKYDLSEARTDFKITELPGEGDIVIPITLTGTAQIEFNSPGSHNFELSQYEPLRIKFHTLYLSNTAQTGKTLKLLIGKGTWELDKKVMQPVDLQAQLRSEVANTNTPLAVNDSYTSSSFDALNYSKLTLIVYADQASATDGLEIQESTDAENWDYITTQTISASSGKVITLDLSARYVRVKYTNGATAQGTFRLMALARVI